MLKSVEIFCPNLTTTTVPKLERKKSRLRKVGSRDSIATAVTNGTDDDGELFLDELICSCLSVCQGAGPQPKSSQHSSHPSPQQPKQLITHVLRAELRNGRKFVFLVEGDDGWKIGVGLQRMRKGRALTEGPGTTESPAQGNPNWTAKGLMQDEAKVLIMELTKGEANGGGLT
ncbi:hypothetical protein BDZ91DRAFT_718510 [Kalaharituber pfeilii]|nr:hypothetical protein BDZ91DRAFT_718510 [Kalaharituber pfeilii]